MRLDIECVRDVMLCVDENTGPHKFCQFIDEYMMREICAALEEPPEPVPEYQKALQERYSGDVLVYHVKYCTEAGLIKNIGGTDGYKIIVPGVTAAGHELLIKSESPKAWAKFKKALAKIGPEIAAPFIAEIIKNYLSGNNPVP